VAERVQLINQENPGTLPAVYQLPPGLDLVLSSVVARFNGAAAAATFIPVLEVLSQDDKLMARVRPDQEFAVGDTGVVTFAPFLRRQAAAAAAGAGIEWCQATANNQSLGASLTALEFSGLGGDFDSDIPTFSLSGGDLVIGTHGLYSFVLVSRGWTLNPNVVTVLKLEFARTAGTLGDWSGASSGAAGFAVATRLLRFDNGTDDFSPISNPDLFTYVAWDSGIFSAPTLQATAFVEEDEVGTATTTSDWRLFAVRHGSVFGA